MAKYYQDYVGLNTFIYEPTGWDPENQNAVYTALSYEGRETKLTNIGRVNLQVYLNHFGIDLAFGTNSTVLPLYTGFVFKNFRFSHQLPTTASFFPALMLHRNGPYGYPMWKQTRVSENPLTRKQKQNNVITIIEEPGGQFTFTRNNRTITQMARYGSIKQYSELPVMSKFRPVVVHGGINVPLTNNPAVTQLKAIAIFAPMANNINQFTNQELNQKTERFRRFISNPYEALKSRYLNGVLFTNQSPLDVFDKVLYKEIVYPQELYTYKNFRRQRTTFTFPWKDLRSERTANVASSNGLGSNVSQSVWVMDAQRNFDTGVRTTTGSLYYGLVANHSTTTYSGFTDQGILQNQYSFADHNMHREASLSSSALNSIIRAAPIYNRKHFLTHKDSCRNVNGMPIEGISYGSSFGNLTNRDLPSGEAKWEAASQSGLKPFYNTYEDYIQGPRQFAKEYGIVPEFKISNHVEFYRNNSVIEENLNVFELTGGLLNRTGSNEQNFYETYSNSDFMKYFRVVLNDHEEMGEPVELKMTCEIIKKLAPYEGFYPQQRTVQMAQQFFNDYSSSIGFSSSFSNGWIGSNSDRPHVAMQNVLTPLMAPGILFNSIKSGVAVDYPIITKTLEESGKSNSRVFKDTNSNYFLAFSGSNGGIGKFKMLDNEKDGVVFDNRVSFETLLNPDQLGLTHCNEPSNFSNHSSSAKIAINSGQTNYTLMINNFLAETADFFLKNKKYTSFVSKPSNEIPLFEANKEYSMRVKMFKSSDSVVPQVSGSNTTKPFLAPQYADANTENFTMYSRPTAFGPPVGISVNELSYSVGVTPMALGAGIIRGNRPLNGENYPFTPPYYHGQAWADITFTPTASAAYTIPQIIQQSKVKYYRYVHKDTGTGEDIFGRSDNTKPNGFAYGENFLYNVNALQLSASVNLFNFKRDTPGDLTEETARWVIQSKWECPMLNFNRLQAKSSVTLPTNGSASAPRGMWHQYGRLEPNPSKGVFMQITDLDEDWITNILGKTTTNVLPLKEHLGFANSESRLGEIADSKEIKEAVVAVPYIEEQGERKYFHIPREDINNALSGQQDLVGQSVFKMVANMLDFVLPPSMDFIITPEIEPFAMYIFPFTHTLDKRDLANIWQGLYPKVSTKAEKSSVTISHKLLAKELLGGGAVLTQNGQTITIDNGSPGTPLPHRIRWMVFKAKQRAKTSYYDTILGQQTSAASANNAAGGGGGPVTGASAFEIPRNTYNWPYDFFSLIELVKLGTEVSLGQPAETSSTSVTVPQGATTTNVGPVTNTGGGTGGGNMAAPQNQATNLTGQALAAAQSVYDARGESFVYTCAQLAGFVNAGLTLFPTHQQQYDACVSAATN